MKIGDIVCILGGRTIYRGYNGKVGIVKGLDESLVSIESFSFMGFDSVLIQGIPNGYGIIVPKECVFQLIKLTALLSQSNGFLPYQCSTITNGTVCLSEV